MQAPALFVDDVILPGMGSELPLSEAVKQQLAKVWEIEGFGCVDVVILAPRDFAAPCGPDNHAAFATLAEVTLDGDTAALVATALSEGHRVHVEGLASAPAAYAHVWDGQFAEVESAPPNAEGFAETELATLEARVTGWLLNDACQRDVSDVVVALAGLAQPRASLWRSVYVLAGLALSCPSARSAFLAESSLSAAAEIVVEQISSVEDAGEAQRAVELSAFFDYAIDGGLERSVQLFDAVAVMARGGLTHDMISPELKQLRAELVQLVRRAHALADEVSERAAALGRAGR